MPSPAGPAPRQTRILRGVLLISLATGFFVVMNTGAKVLSAHLPVVEIIWARSLVHLVFVFALFAPTSGGWCLFVTRRAPHRVAGDLTLESGRPVVGSGTQGRVTLQERARRRLR